MPNLHSTVPRPEERRHMTTPTATQATRASRADIGHDGTQPYLQLWDPTSGDKLRYPLTPSETAAFVRRMAGYLEQLVRQDRGLPQHPTDHYTHEEVHTPPTST